MQRPGDPTPGDQGSSIRPDFDRVILDDQRIPRKTSASRHRTNLHNSIARDKPHFAQRVKKALVVSQRNAPRNSHSAPLIIPARVPGLGPNPWNQDQGNTSDQTQPAPELEMSNPHPAEEPLHTPTESVLSTSEADAALVEQNLLDMTDSNSFDTQPAQADLFSDIPHNLLDHTFAAAESSNAAAESSNAVATFFGHAPEMFSEASITQFYGGEYTQSSIPESVRDQRQNEDIEQNIRKSGNLEESQQEAMSEASWNGFAQSFSSSPSDGEDHNAPAVTRSPSMMSRRIRSSSLSTVRGITESSVRESRSPRNSPPRYAYHEKGKWTGHEQYNNPTTQRSSPSLTPAENEHVHDSEDLMAQDANSQLDPQRELLPTDGISSKSNEDHSFTEQQDESEDSDVMASEDEDTAEQAGDADQASTSKDDVEDHESDKSSANESYQEEDTAKIEKRLARLRQKKYAKRGASKGDINRLYEYIRRKEKDRRVQRQRDKHLRNKHYRRLSPTSSSTSSSRAGSPAFPHRPHDSRKQKPLYRLAQTKHRSPNEVELQYHIRVSAQDFMGRASHKDPLPPSPSPAEKLAARQGQSGPSDTDRRPDTTGRNRRGPWNQQLATVFSKTYVQQQDPMTRNRRKVEAAFLAHIPALCKQAAKSRPGKLLNNHAVVKNRRRVRQKKLGEFRWEDSHLLPALRPASKWINRLGREGNSEDESDADVPLVPGVPVAYGRVPTVWRSQELVNLLRALDIFRVSNHFTDEGKPMPGQWPRYRCNIPGRRPDPSAKAVPGLPRNFYNEDWLKSRTSDELEALNIREDVEINLRLPQELKSIVARFRHIRTRRDRPLPASLTTNNIM